MPKHMPKLGAALQDATPINPVAMEREHRMTRFVQTVAVALSLLWSVGVVSAATYSFTTLDYPGATQTEAYGVNDAGHVVGVYRIGISNPRGFVFDGATYTDVPVTVCTQIQAYGITNRDEIVGTCSNTSGTHGFFKDPSGVEIIYDAPGAVSTGLQAVNSAGVMAGGFDEGSGITHGVVTDTAESFTLVVDVPGAKGTGVWGLNASNVMAGYYSDAGNQVHGFTSPDGSSFDFIDVPGATATQAFGITTAGQVSGTYYVSGVGHGFLKDGASYTTIDYPGASFTAVRGISPDGTKLAGAFVDASSRVRGFLATTRAADTTSPVVTVAANPTTLRPPNGALIPVTVTGSITDSGSGVNVSTAAFAVMDEYQAIQPTGPVSLQPNGSNTFTVQLQASRRGQDQDGRHYTIAVSAKDLAGNPGVGTAVVVVPHG
jgi:hypothetical protein